MQQTENLNLNLIEGSDPVDWAVLNENMEKLDGETADIREILAATAASIGSGGKTCRMAFGTYQGTGTGGESNPTTVTVDFTPVLVIAGTATSPSSLYWPAIMIRPMTLCYSDSTYSMTVVWGSNSVKWYVADGSAMNSSGTPYVYVVLGYSEA